MLDKLLEWSPNLGVDTFLLLTVLVALETLLSADNAIALAAIAQGLDGPKMQRDALNFGLVVAFIFRVILILTATWVIQFWQFELAGALYLLWLVYQYFSSDDAEDGDHHHHGPRFASLWQAIPMIAVTDLAFSLDSVTTAIALSQEIWLVLTGGLIGIITLRLLAGLFIRWLDEYVHLEDAGYVTVGLVGLRLLVKVFNDSLVPPQWVMISVIALLFVWGFSERKPEAAIAPDVADAAPTHAASTHAASTHAASTDAAPANGTPPALAREAATVTPPEADGREAQEVSAD